MSKAKKVHKENSAMSKLLKEKDLQMKELKPGELIEGYVISVTHGEILVDVGAKSEGIITGAELEETDGVYKGLKAGDHITAKIVQPENMQGYIVLSLRESRKR